MAGVAFFAGHCPLGLALEPRPEPELKLELDLREDLVVEPMIPDEEGVAGSGWPADTCSEKHLGID